MFGYLLFIIRCVLGKFKFFKLSPLKKARFLRHCHLYFEAGTIYMHQGHYSHALACFKKCNASRHMFHCYQKLGQVSLALEVADTYKLYKQGAALCMRTENFRKAAYFYTYFDMPKAIKLYKKLNAHYELGHCYLVTYRFFPALQAFLDCRNPSDKLMGLQLIEEIAIVHYFTKHYEDAIKLFTGLGDYYSVLECAKKLEDLPLIQQTSKNLASSAFEEGQFLEAAYYIAPYNPTLARLYYYLAQTDATDISVAIYEKRYFEALRFCFQSNELLLAKQISRLWLQAEDMPFISLSA